MTGFAYRSGGWDLDARGQLVRATNVRHKLARLFQPLFGAVPGEPHRGVAPWPKKDSDAMRVIIADRVRLVLAPMIDAGEIAAVAIEVAREPGQNKFYRVRVTGTDAGRRPFEHAEFVRVP